MAGPFENDQERYVVLINDEGQHSLWPELIAVPAGWSRSFGPESRKSCLEYVEKHWTDMRPESLAKAIAR